MLLPVRRDRFNGYKLQGPETTNLNSNNSTGDINGNADFAETGGRDLSWLMGEDFV